MFHDDIVFQGISSNFCVCMLDVVNSTAITSSLAYEDKIRKFYSVFVNSISPVISHFGGRVLKTGGDSIIYYFPNTSEVECIDSQLGKRVSRDLRPPMNNCVPRIFYWFDTDNDQKFLLPNKYLEK
mgnify:CR=1 FL=1